MIIEHIKKNYGKKAVLSDVSLTAKPGMCIGILGGNGSGKSTLLNILAGIFKADGGTFTYKETDLLRKSTTSCKGTFAANACIQIFFKSL